MLQQFETQSMHRQLLAPSNAMLRSQPGIADDLEDCCGGCALWRCQGRCAYTVPGSCGVVPRLSRISTGRHPTAVLSMLSSAAEAAATAAMPRSSSTDFPRCRTLGFRQNQARGKQVGRTLQACAATPVSCRSTSWNASRGSLCRYACARGLCGCSLYPCALHLRQSCATRAEAMVRRTSGVDAHLVFHQQLS